MQYLSSNLIHHHAMRIDYGTKNRQERTKNMIAHGRFTCD